MSIISFYFRDTLNLVDFAIIPVLITEIILVMLAFNLVIYYSIMICTIGFLATSIIESLSLVIGEKLSITSAELIQKSVLHLNGMQLTSTIIMFLLIFFLQRKKIGFMFVLRNLVLHKALRGYNFLLSGILIISIVYLQLSLISFTNFSVHVYIPLIMAFFFIAGVGVAYKNNKKILKQKDERLTKQ